MDSEQSAATASAQRHHKYMTFGKKQRYIEVFQCSIDDMNLVLTGGLPVQRPMISPGWCTFQLLNFSVSIFRFRILFPVSKVHFFPNCDSFQFLILS